MNRTLVALSAVCLPTLGVAAPPSIEPVDVNVTNPVVPVEVSNADPIPVIVNSNEERYQFGSVPTAFTGSSVSRAIVTVPAGKALVIEHVSASIGSNSTYGLNSVNLNRLVVENNVGHVEADEVPCTQQGATSNGLSYFFSCSAQTRFYVASGQTLNFAVGLVESNGGYYRVFMSGHWVTTP